MCDRKNDFTFEGDGTAQAGQADNRPATICNQLS